MPPPVVALVRHASTAWSGRRYCGRSDPPLDAAGRRSTEPLAAELAARLGPDPRVLTSPSRRALETAHVIAAALGARVEIDARWREADMGAAEGRTFDELAVSHGDLATALAAGVVDIDWPDGETAAALGERVDAAWRDVLATDRAIVVVTHAGPLRLAVALAIGRPAGAVGLARPGQVVWLDPGAGRIVPDSTTSADRPTRPPPRVTLGR